MQLSTSAPAFLASVTSAGAPVPRRRCAPAPRAAGGSRSPDGSRRPQISARPAGHGTSTVWPQSRSVLRACSSRREAQSCHSRATWCGQPGSTTVHRSRDARVIWAAARARVTWTPGLPRAPALRCGCPRRRSPRSCPPCWMPVLPCEHQGSHAAGRTPGQDCDGTCGRAPMKSPKPDRPRARQHRPAGRQFLEKTAQASIVRRVRPPERCLRHPHSRSYSGALHLDALNHARSTVCGSKAEGMAAGTVVVPVGARPASQSETSNWAR